MAFFDSTRPGSEVSHAAATFELPILYFRDDLFLLFYRADYGKVKELMPSDKLHPVSLMGNQALLGVAAFNYRDTTIGPYGEVGIVIPSVYGKKPLPVLPGLQEANYPGFGVLVLHLPVTKSIARDAGRGEWGYTKFVADMKFTNTPELHRCELSEGKHILTMQVAKRGAVKKDRKPLITYSVKDGKLIKTVVAQTGICRNSYNAKGSYLELGDHPVADSIRELNLSEKPFQSRYYIERSGILPAGEVIEENVKPLEGYLGSDREGEHTTEYVDTQEGSGEA